MGKTYDNNDREVSVARARMPDALLEMWYDVSSMLSFKAGLDDYGAPRGE